MCSVKMRNNILAVHHVVLFSDHFCDRTPYQVKMKVPCLALSSRKIYNHTWRTYLHATAHESVWAVIDIRRWHNWGWCTSHFIKNLASYPNRTYDEGEDDSFRARYHAVRLRSLCLTNINSAQVLGLSSVIEVIAYPTPR